MNRNLKYLVGFMFFLVSSPLYAIVTIEDIRIDPLSQPLGLKTNINIDLSGKNGNTNNSKYSLGTKA